MHAFEVHLNGKKRCVAGVGADGVLTAIVNYVARNNEPDIFLQVGGLLSKEHKHVRWVSRQSLNVGDEIRVVLVETPTVDRPKSSQKEDPAKDLAAKKSYAVAMAKQLGWTIQKKSKKTKSS